jgi:hypothetical protein
LAIKVCGGPEMFKKRRALPLKKGPEKRSSDLD